MSDPTYTLAAALEAVDDLVGLIDPLLEVAAIDVADIHGTNLAGPLVAVLGDPGPRRKLARCLVERLVHDEEIGLYLTDRPEETGTNEASP